MEGKIEREWGRFILKNENGTQLYFLAFTMKLCFTIIPTAVQRFFHEMVTENTMRARIVKRVILPLHGICLHLQQI